MNFELSFETINKDNLMVMRPTDEMTDATYDKLKQYMEGMGGHWRERVRGFVFYTQNLKRNSFQNWKESNQFFPTPEHVANRVYQLSGLSNWSLLHDGRPIVLEPSAGTGSLLHEIPSDINCKFYIVEPEIHNAKQLEDEGYDVNRCTFEKFYSSAVKTNTRFTHVLMNPPFSQSRDIKHTLMAYDLLEPDGRLVSIISENAMYYANEYSNKFRQWINDTNAIIEPISSTAFKESGTTVDTVIIVVNKK